MSFFAQFINCCLAGLNAPCLYNIYGCLPAHISVLSFWVPTEYPFINQFPDLQTIQFSNLFSWSQHCLVSIIVLLSEVSKIIEYRLTFLYSIYDSDGFKSMLFLVCFWRKGVEFSLVSLVTHPCIQNATVAKKFAPVSSNLTHACYFFFPMKLIWLHSFIQRLFTLFHKTNLVTFKL